MSRRFLSFTVVSMLLFASSSALAREPGPMELIGVLATTASGALQYPVFDVPVSFDLSFQGELAGLGGVQPALLISVVPMLFMGRLSVDLRNDEYGLKDGLL